MFRPVKLHQQPESSSPKSETEAASSIAAKSLRISGQKKSAEELVGSTKLHSPLLQKSRLLSPLNRISPLRSSSRGQQQQQQQQPEQRNSIISNNNDNDVVLQPCRGSPISPRTSARVVLDPLLLHSNQSTNMLADSGFFSSSVTKKTSTQQQQKSVAVGALRRLSSAKSVRFYQKEQQREDEQQPDPLSLTYHSSSRSSIKMSKQNNNSSTNNSKINISQRKTGMDVLFSLPGPSMMMPPPTKNPLELAAAPEITVTASSPASSKREEENSNKNEKPEKTQDRQQQSLVHSSTVKTKTTTTILKPEQQQQKPIRTDLMPMWKSSAKLMNNKESKTQLTRSAILPSSCSSSSSSKTSTTAAEAALHHQQQEQPIKKSERKMTFAEYIEARKQLDLLRDKTLQQEREQRDVIENEQRAEFVEISSFEKEEKQFDMMIDRLEEEQEKVLEHPKQEEDENENNNQECRHEEETEVDHEKLDVHHCTARGDENEKEVDELSANEAITQPLDLVTECSFIANSKTSFENEQEQEQQQKQLDTTDADNNRTISNINDHDEESSGLQLDTDKDDKEDMFVDGAATMKHEKLKRILMEQAKEEALQYVLDADEQQQSSQEDKEETAEEEEQQQHHQHQQENNNNGKQEVNTSENCVETVDDDDEQQQQNRTPDQQGFDLADEDMSGDDDDVLLPTSTTSSPSPTHQQQSPLSAARRVSFVNITQDNDDQANENNATSMKINDNENNNDNADSVAELTAAATAAPSWKPLVKKKVFTPLGDRVFDDEEEAEIALQCSSLPLYDVFRAEIRNGRRRWLCGDPILVSRILTFVFGGPLPSRDQYPDGPAMTELAMKYVNLLKEFVVGAVLLSFLPNGDLADTRHPVVRIVSHSLTKRYFEDFAEFTKTWKRQATLHRQLANPRSQHAFRTPNGLLFSGAFDGGNLSHVEQHPGLFGSPPVYQVWITSDAELVSGFRFWFQFTITNLHLAPNLHDRKECLCLRVMNVIFRESFDYIEKVRPVWSSDSAPLEWHPCAEARIDYERLATECRMSFYIPPTYPADTQVLHVAFNVPYNVASLSRSLIYWDTMAQIEQNKKYVKFVLSNLCSSSPDERPIYCIEITGSAKMQRRRQRSVFITARANAGDHSASHAMHAIISFLLFDRSYNAKHLRECFTFYILPMINPDGIARGHSRLDGRGENLNTTYDLPHSKRHPAQHAFEYKFWKTHRQFGRPAMYIDLQSQIPSSNCYIYGNPGGANGEGSFEMNQHSMIFARAFERNVPKGTFSADSNFLPQQALDEISGSSRRHYGPHVEHCYTLHIPHIYESQVNHSGKSLWHPTITHEKQEGENQEYPLTSVPVVKMFADYGRGVLQALADITQILMTPKNPPERPQIRGRRFGGYIKEYVTDPDLQSEVDAANDADDPEGGSAIKFFKVAKSQLERDYVLLIDRSRSMLCGSRWADAENAVSLLAPQICEFDPDGITLIFFDHEPVKFENVQTGEEVKELFERHPPRGTTDLALALDMAFVDHFSGYRGSTTILCITDGRPNNTEQVKEVITEAANTLGCDAELSISLVQIGANVKATEYLKELDDELGDAKYDIVDAITAEEVKDISFNELIARSMLD